MTMATVSASAEHDNSGATSISITMPTPIAAGDLIVVFLAANTTAANAGVTPATPSGYTSIGTEIQSSSQGYGFYKVAAGTEAGTTLSFTTSSAGSKQLLHVMVLSGSGGITWTLANATTALDNTSETAHTAPANTFSGSNVSIVHFVWEKSSTPGTAWTPPTGFTNEVTTFQTGGGALTAVTALSNTNTVTSPQAAVAYTETTATAQAGMFTVAFNGAPSGGGGGGGGGGTIAFVDKAVNNQNTSTATVVVPSLAAGGDVALLFYDINTSSTTNPPAPTGWTQIATLENSGTAASLAYYKVLTSGDLGSTVSLDWGSTTKITTTMVVYSGVSTTTPIDGSNFAPQTTASANHTTPTVTVVTTGALAVEHAFDKGATGNTSWTTPGADTLRATEAISGSANPSAVTGEVTSTFTSGGTAGGNTWVSGQVYVGGTWTIVLRPGTAPSGGAIVFIDKVVSNANASSYSVTIPLTAATGQAALLFADIATTSAIPPTPPTGWTQLGSAVNSASTMISLCYYRMLTGGDLGSVVTLSWGSVTEGSLTLVIYDNVEPTLPIDGYQAIPNTVPSTTHSTPLVTTVNGSDKAIEHVADFATVGNTTWTVPTGLTERALNAPGGSNNISSDTGEVSATLTSGENIGGDTWTSGQSAISVTWTVLLAPSGATPLAVTEFFAKAGAWVALPTFHL